MLSGNRLDILAVSITAPGLVWHYRQPCAGNAPHPLRLQSLSSREPNSGLSLETPGDNASGASGVRAAYQSPRSNGDGPLSTSDG
jgi:hypothetical protein